MLGGVGLAYAWFGSFAGRFLFPAKSRQTIWQFVTLADRLQQGDSLLYEAPGGEPINIARQGNRGDVSDFIALSSTCPHLGCQVNWEAQHSRFFCPCHNGMFDENGVAFSGPPAESGQSLPRYALNLEDNKLFIEVPPADLAKGSGRILKRATTPRGAGHDPILANDGIYRGRSSMRDA
jgi:nitrite reductase/ring-hydroxylating ferredoxin subunit